MIEFNDLKAALILKRMLGMRSIAVYGHCDGCGKEITFIVHVDDWNKDRDHNERAQESFSWFWESTAIDCRLSRDEYI